MAPRRQREHLPGRLQPVGHRERHRSGYDARPLAHLSEGLAVPVGAFHGHDLVDDHVVGLSSGDGHRGVEERAAHRTSTATPRLAAVAQALGAERGVELGRFDRARVRAVTVDLLGGDPRVVACLRDRLDHEPKMPLVGVLATFAPWRVPDACDRGATAEPGSFGHPFSLSVLRTGPHCSTRGDRLVACRVTRLAATRLMRRRRLPRRARRRCDQRSSRAHPALRRCARHTAALARRRRLTVRTRPSGCTSGSRRSWGASSRR